MSRFLIFAYGVASYAVFFCVFLYAIGFVGNFGVPKTMDSGPSGPVGQALLVNALLLGLFAVQHSVMARPGFKAWLTRFVPTPAERSTYCFASSACMILLFWQWQPMGAALWHVDSETIRMGLAALCVSGFLIVLLSSFAINHFDLFGLRQVWLHLRGREYTPLTFQVSWPYKYVRHPLYVGWLLAFWATPTMTVAHLIFSLACTAYILVAIKLEERDLCDALPDYADYRRSVPMLLPRRPRQVGSVPQMVAATANTDSAIITP